MRIPDWAGIERAGRWAAELGRVLNSAISDLQQRKQTRGEVVQMKHVAVAELPDPLPDGQWVYVSDEAGGATPAFSSGGQWLRVTDRAVVS